MKGVVLWGTGGQWHVRTDDGVTRLASLRGRVKNANVEKLAVGDRVDVAPADGDRWAITGIDDRRSVLSRRSPGGARGERVLVANLDQVIVVLAIHNPEPNEGMLDRFLVIAEANDLVARIVVNKVDLASAAAVRARFGPYERAGYVVLCTSSRTGDGLEALHDLVHGTVSALTGPSGAGKSSLLNALYPGLDLRVGEVSASVNKGRHTTVGALMHPLPDGGYVVDTPGLREVGLWALSSSALDQCFPEFGRRVGDCRFADCRHLAEPGCTVRLAVEQGTIAASRYESYVRLHQEARDAERQAGDQS